jgi:hypothetical protein
VCTILGADLGKFKGVGCLWGTLSAKLCRASIARSIRAAGFAFVLLTHQKVGNLVSARQTRND